MKLVGVNEYGRGVYYTPNGIWKLYFKEESWVMTDEDTSAVTFMLMNF